jgi:hypothetical protein
MATTALWLSFAGGMNAAPGPYRLTAEDEAPLIVNGTVRNGWIQTRPPWQVRPLRWDTLTAQRAFERGVFQGGCFYDGPDGPRLVVAFSGEVLILDPAGYTVKAALPKAPFSKGAPEAFFQQRGKHLVCQDGINPPVILTGDAAVQGTDPARGFPTGEMMADGWGRTAVVMPGRRRIQFSDHENDPTRDSVLSFTEDTEYFKNARWFEIPGSLGLITGIIFAPALGRNGDQGPLLVFCEKGVRAYNVSLPRETWTTVDITSTPLPETGGGAPNSLVARGDDVIFTAHDGRIMSLKAALRRDEDARLSLFDNAVWPLYAGGDGTHLFRRWAARHDGRTLVTVEPERVPGNSAEEPTRVRHRGIVALQESPSIVREAPVWDGLWTGIYPVCLMTGTIKGVPHCWAISLDDDGVHRLYELGTEGPDVGEVPRRIETLVKLRASDFDMPYRPKPYASSALRLDEVKGRVTVEGWWQQDGHGPVPWFVANETNHDAWRAVEGSEVIQVPAPLRLPRMNPPAPPVDRPFHEVTPWIRITGQASFAGMAMETGEPKASPDGINTRAGGKEHCSEIHCVHDPYGYNARSLEKPEPCL